MNSLKDIFSFTETFAPLSLAEEWDNPGILIGNEDTPVSKVLLSLDITNDVVNEAKRKECQLIISHHPVIFRPVSSVDPGDAVYNLIHSDICALCLHTNLDRSEEGVNRALADALSLKEQEYHLDDFIITGKPEKPFTPDEFARFIKQRLDAGAVRYTDKGKISKIAVSSGGGGEGIFLSSVYDFDAFIAGEIKHHEFIFANEKKICAYEAGHYATEAVVLRPFMKKLQKRFPDICFEISQDENDPCRYI